MRFAKCYTTIMRFPGLSAVAKGVYACLKSHTSEKDNRAWPAQKTLAKYMKVGERMIRKAIVELWRWEIIQWNQGYSGKANTYFLTDQKGVARILRGDGPLVPGDPRSIVPPKETHVQERPAKYGEKRA